jgi:tetratricopeptide (TPR) repeat protein
VVERELASALVDYDEASKVDTESAVVYANRSLVYLRSGKLEECVRDADHAVAILKGWPVARRAPKPPARPARLDPPYIDDATFKHPDEQKQGEVDWLMKHSGGDSKNLPSLPPDYEWVKDTGDKIDNSWIAIRKKMSKATFDAIKEATKQLQESLYTRNSRIIREQLEHSMEGNRHGEGPSDKAIRQALDFAQKIDDHTKEQEANRLSAEEELRQEIEECDLEESLDPARSGVAKAGFVRRHPVESAQRRLFSKILLRRARAYELLGKFDTCARDIRVVCRLEPENREAKQRLSTLQAMLDQLPKSESPGASVNLAEEAAPASTGGPGDEAGGGMATPGFLKPDSDLSALG